VSDLTSPGAVQARLQEIEQDLAIRQLEFERAALAWFRAKREKEKHRAEVFLSSDGSVAARSALADEETALQGADEEARYEAQKAVVRVLDTRAAIGMALLKAQGRGA
jgi:hypothetical protein